MIEADFQREYGINLVEALPMMSWRRFLTLKNGLGPNSVYIITLKERFREQQGFIQDPDKAERAIEAIWG